MFNKSILPALIPFFLFIGGCDDASTEKVNNSIEQTKDKAADLKSQTNDKASELTH